MSKGAQENKLVVVSSLRIHMWREGDESCYLIKPLKKKGEIKAVVCEDHHDCSLVARFAEKHQTTAMI
jgi:hypothetical protein